MAELCEQQASSHLPSRAHRGYSPVTGLTALNYSPAHDVDKVDFILPHFSAYMSACHCTFISISNDIKQ